MARTSKEAVITYICNALGFSSMRLEKKSFSDQKKPLGVDRAEFNNR
jgi:hypothetical protein